MLVDLTQGRGLFVGGLQADGSGALEVTLDIPADAVIQPGTGVSLQVLSRAGAGHHWSSSDGLKATLMPAR